MKPYGNYISQITGIKLIGIDMGYHVAMAECKDECDNQCDTCEVLKRLRKTIGDTDHE